MKVSEPTAVYGARHQELQTLRHRLTDAVYASSDVEKLRSCLVMLTKQDASCVSVDNVGERVLTREEGENLLRETLLPAYKDVMDAEKTGLDFPDAHDLLAVLND